MHWPSHAKPPENWGWGTTSSTPAAFGDTKHHETGQLAESIEQADGFAQVFPEHKFHIVDVLQQRGHIVGMTGDGVNDAPALKKADCGIAVSGATDAAARQRRIVLLTPGLSVIIDAIKESRKIFQRMNSYAIYRIAETIRVLLFMTLSILVFNFYPVTAVMIVMLALLERRRHPVDRLRQRSLRRPARSLEHADGLGNRHGAGGGRCWSRHSACFILADGSFTWTVTSIQSLIYLKLSVAGHLTIFRDAHAGAILVDPSGADLARGRARHASHRDVDRRIRLLNDADRLGLGAVRLGLCVGVVPGQRPHQTAGLSRVRSDRDALVVKAP